MPITRFFLRGAGLLAAVCALMAGTASGMGKIMPGSAGIIYYAVEERLQRNTYLLDAHHQVRYNLSAHQQLAHNAVVVPSPDGQKIALLYHSADFSEVRVFDLNSGQTVPIFRKTEAIPNRSSLDLFSWSPTGRYLSFSSNGRLLKYEAATGEVSSLIGEDRSDGFTRDAYPAWSPDEARIAFVSTLRETANWQVYLVNADGSDLRRATRVDVCTFYTPRWSPTSSMLAIDANCENFPAIFLLDADSGILRPLTNLTAPMSTPSWSPDGSKLLFISGVRERSIYTTAADGSGLHHLTDGNFAVWSPDGESILFSASEGDLYTIGAAGGNLRRLTFDGSSPFLIAAG